MNKLEIIKQTRKIAADTLLDVLKDVLNSENKISESEFAQKWLLKIRKHPEIFPDGWYDPPLNGIGILFSDSNNTERISYDNLRLEKNWPKKDIFLDKENGLAYFYASPLNKETGIIGDFGVTLYFGNDNEIKNHLQNCLSINKQIFNFANDGMSFSQVYKFAENLFRENNLSNQVLSITDPSKINFGHTVPSTDIDWTEEELNVLKNGSWEEVKELISKRRIFLNSTQQFRIKPGVAFTIEPRLKKLDNPNLPTSLSFHTIALFNKNGEKELITNFDEIFKLVGMNYMLD